MQDNYFNPFTISLVYLNYFSGWRWARCYGMSWNTAKCSQMRDLYCSYIWKTFLILCLIEVHQLWNVQNLNVENVSVYDFDRRKQMSSWKVWSSDEVGAASEAKPTRCSRSCVDFCGAVDATHLEWRLTAINRWPCVCVCAYVFRTYWDIFMITLLQYRDTSKNLSVCVCGCVHWQNLSELLKIKFTFDIMFLRNIFDQTSDLKKKHFCDHFNNIIINTILH